MKPYLWSLASLLLMGESDGTRPQRMTFDFEGVSGQQNITFRSHSGNQCPERLWFLFWPNQDYCDISSRCLLSSLDGENPWPEFDPQNGFSYQTRSISTSQTSVTYILGESCGEWPKTTVCLSSSPNNNTDKLCAVVFRPNSLCHDASEQDNRSRELCLPKDGNISVAFLDRTARISAGGNTTDHDYGCATDSQLICHNGRA